MSRRDRDEEYDAEDTLDEDTLDEDTQDLADAVNGVAQRVEEPRGLERDEVAPLPEAAANAPFPVAVPAIRRTAETEDLLNGLIAECHYLMREVALPSAASTSWVDSRNTYLTQAMRLAGTGAEIAGAVAKLRIADRVTPEAQGRIIDAVAKTITEAG
ncbi:MAG: hypothetical protein JOZ72_18115 [Alphaproteobacteria bacterium]|nr:hypothetical protein [Alphaproteobacteria bacterium]